MAFARFETGLVVRRRPEHLSDFSIETTDENLLRWLLRHGPTRKTLQHLQANSGAAQIEVVLANSQILVRGYPRNWKVGAAVQHIGPSLVDVMRRLSMNLADLSGAMVRAGDDDRAVDECPVCAQTIAGDPHQCQGCGVYASWLWGTRWRLLHKRLFDGG